MEVLECRGIGLLGGSEGRCEGEDREKTPITNLLIGEPRTARAAVVMSRVIEGDCANEYLMGNNSGSVCGGKHVRTEGKAIDSARNDQLKVEASKTELGRVFSQPEEPE
jgi:hypothetical protein